MSEEWAVLDHDNLVGGDWPEDTPLLAEGKSGVLFPQGRAIVYGAPGSYKSYLMQQLGYCAAAGLDWLNYSFAQICKVVYVVGEGVPAMYAARARGISSGQPTLGRFHIVMAGRDRKLINEARWVHMAELVERYMPNILIIDPIYQFMSGGENDDQATGEFVGHWDWLVDRYKLLVILVHHQNKASMSFDSDGYIGLRGHSNLIGWPDTILAVRRARDGPEIVLRWEKIRRSGESPARVVRFDGQRMVVAETDPATVMLELLERGSMSPRALDDEVAEICGLGRRTIENVRATLERAGRIHSMVDKKDKRRRLVSLTRE